MQTLCSIAHYDYRIHRAYSYEQALSVMRALRLPYSAKMRNLSLMRSARLHPAGRRSRKSAVCRRLQWTRLKGICCLN